MLKQLYFIIPKSLKGQVYEKTYMFIYNYHSVIKLVQLGIICIMIYTFIS